MRLENLFVTNDKITIIIRKNTMYDATLEITILSIILLKKFTKLSPYLYEPRNETIQVNSDKNSWENPLIKEKKADKTTKNKIEISRIK